VRYPDLLVIALSIISAFPAIGVAASFNFAGVPFTSGSTVRANVPLNAQERSYAAQGGNAVPQSALAVLATPARCGFSGDANLRCRQPWLSANRSGLRIGSNDVISNSGIVKTGCVC
jgi:hypothetical protein